MKNIVILSQIEPQNLQGSYKSNTK